MKKFQTMLLGLLGWASLVTKENLVSLTEDEKTSLNSMLGEENASKLIAEVNNELKGVDNAIEALSNIQGDLAKKEQESLEKESLLQTLSEKLNNQQQTIANLSDTINKLKDEPDNAIQLINENSKKLGKGVTAAFSIGNQLMGYEGNVWAIDRPWNARALEGATGSTTNFKSSVAIQKMNDDLYDFIQENPDKIDSLFSQYFALPSHWPVISGVADRLTSAQIIVGEITQPRKAKWSPKGDVTIKPEEMYVRPAQIDIQFNYWELQKLETNWLHNFNREGSQAYKMTFIEFIVTEFTKKARAEDADVLINGVYVPTPEGHDPEKQVSYLNRNSGLRKLILDARDVFKKYRPFNVGIPTAATIVDYVDGMIANLPAEVRTQPLQFILSPSWLRTYKRTYENIFGQNTDYKGMPNTPKDYPNVTFVPLQQMEGSDLMVVTFMDNIKVLEYKPQEKSMYTIEKFLRDVYFFADYKIGIGINHIGLVVKEGTPFAETYQSIWSNNVPAMTANYYAVAYDERTGILSANHNRTYLASDFTTDVTKISGNFGDYIIIRGDISLASEVKLVKDDNFLQLASDFNFKSGGEITLIKVGVDKYKEVSRTTAPSVVSKVVEFTANVFEYAASEYIYKGTAAASLSEILGGTEGNTVRIYGNANALTIANVAGKIKLAKATACVLNSEAKYIDLIFVGGQWNEMSRG